MDQDRALEIFLASVERQAFRMAMIATSSREDALDIVQDTMLGLVRRYGSKPVAELIPLFYRILQSRIRDWYRRQKVRNRWRVWLGRNREGEDDVDPFQSVPAPAKTDPASEVAESHSLARLEESLKTLPLRQQQTFLLRAWQGLSVAETALAMSCSQSSVKTHYSRAVQALQKKMKGHWP